MSTKNLIAVLLYAIGLLFGIGSLLVSYTGLTGTMDAEPLLALGLLCIALAGIISIKD